MQMSSERLRTTSKMVDLRLRHDGLAKRGHELAQ